MPHSDEENNADNAWSDDSDTKSNQIGEGRGGIG